MEPVQVQNFGDMVAFWGPRILGALAILLIAYFVGKGVKWAFARVVDRTPALAQHNAGKTRHETVGAKLGDVAFWLILLVGLVAALNVLNLGGVVTPLNLMLSDFLTFIPNMVGAALIFFIGFLLATIVKRLVVTALQAANVERWLARAGLGRASGAGVGLANAVGTLVFVLILIPVTIAALETLQIEAISRPAVAVLSTILNAIPLVLAAAIVLAIGYAIGRWVASVIERILPATGFDRAVMSIAEFSSIKSPPPPTAYTPDTSEPGVAPQAMAEAAEFAAAPAPRASPSRIVAMIAMWGIVAFSAIEAARLLQFASVAEVLENVVVLAGQVLVGGVIIAAGVIIADLLSNAIDRGTAGADRFASTIVRWATIALATAMGLSFMGIADEIVLLAFGLILGSAAVAAALAFGIGGRETAGRLLERWTRQADAARAGVPHARIDEETPPPRRPRGGGSSAGRVQ
ncbi:mechanosensitive ion channel [Caulobacter sp. 17J65-9]|uniref:mechanosensitive ion channel n=1 Tax=Caulobacter sp. 17J65-9 TaxID=2709382 RepID=UPI0013C9F91D|nr:mechanosensitive ion channel [Caulobacter sp. 17J65-9]NEX93422.1 mechanosensitive ion channel [Caulobacter sp. 17J65-9]